MSREAAELVGGARVVLFDCDDTVLATAKTRWQLLIATAAIFGVTLTTGTIRRAWGLPFDRFVEAIVPGVDAAEFVRRYRAAMRAHRPEPAAGAPELLAHLAARATRMEIVTAGRRDLVAQDLDALGLTGYFARIHGYEETRYPKPDPRALDGVLGALAEQGYDVAELVYIGDSVRDYQVAAARSVEFVAVVSGVERAADFRAAGVRAARIVGDLSRLVSGVGVRFG